MQSFKELAILFEQQFQEKTPFPQQPDTLYNPCRYFLENGGKRIRPVLCLMANELFTTICDDAWYAAYAIELFHNFTLIHDDIMDKSPIRRGRPTIHTQFGLTSGILGGDVMCIYAYRYLNAIENSLPEILYIFNQTAIQVCEGQQLDMDFESRDQISLEEYIRMITLKTSVLLACSLKIGAFTGGSLGDTSNNLYEFGKNMGIAFQLQDDYLDSFGQTEKLGKKVGNDIMTNKKTFLLVHAMKNANKIQQNSIVELMNYSGADKITAMLEIFTLTGAREACQKLSLEFADKSFAYLDKVAIPAKRKQQLWNLANDLLTREM